MDMQCDVLIAGGGLVGNSLACALEGSGLRCVLVEASALEQAPPSFDERNLALARASVNALSALGVWRHLAAPAGRIGQILVSSQGDFGNVHLDASARGLSSFGQVVSARALGQALEARVAQLHATRQLRPARVAAIASVPGGMQARIETAHGVQSLQTRLLVAADGSESSLRSALGIGVRRHDYGQTLFVAVLQASAAPPETAYERFTPQGPVALLPLGDGRLGSVCTVPAAQAQAVAAQDEAAYLDYFQQRFGWRVGRFLRAGRRSAHALKQCVAERLHAPRAVLIGNAAQTLHPIGAQGFNLGLRDALSLAEVVRAAHAAGQDIGAASTLGAHAARRLPDREATLALSDGLVRLFANPFAPLRLLRSLGLVALDRFPILADGLVTEAMGLGADVSGWAREVAA